MTKILINRAVVELALESLDAGVPISPGSILHDWFRNALAEDEESGWTKHTNYHWSRIVGGKRLDYWPSRQKWQYEGVVQRGDVQAFIRSKT